MRLLVERREQILCGADGTPPPRLPRCGTGPPPDRLTPGPIPLVFALLVVYYAIVPPSKPRYFGVLGLDFTDKAFTFAVAGMVRGERGRER